MPSSASASPLASSTALSGLAVERELARADLGARADDPDHLRTDALDGEARRLEHARGKALSLTENRDQDVLAADVVVLEDAGLLTRAEEDDMLGAPPEALIHCPATIRGRSSTRAATTGAKTTFSRWTTILSEEPRGVLA
jgi:hypothetical protein